MAALLLSTSRVKRSQVLRVSDNAGEFVLKRGWDIDIKLAVLSYIAAIYHLLRIRDILHMHCPYSHRISASQNMICLEHIPRYQTQLTNRSEQPNLSNESVGLFDSISGYWCHQA